MIGTSSKTRQGETNKVGQSFRKGNEEGKIRDKTRADWPSSQHAERVNDRRDQSNGGISGVMKMEMMKKRGQRRTGQGYRLCWIGRTER